MKPTPLKNERVREDRDPPGYIPTRVERLRWWYFWLPIVAVVCWGIIHLQYCEGC